jgi:hypothetical protein
MIKSVINVMIGSVMIMKVSDDLVAKISCVNKKQKSQNQIMHDYKDVIEQHI